MVKYFDEDFFGRIDHHIRYERDSQYVRDRISFSQMTVNLLSELAGIASVTPDMYALKNIDSSIQNYCWVLQVKVVF
jgi:hypothetical protein